MKNSKNPKITKKMDLSDRVAIELGLCRKEDFKTIAEKNRQASVHHCT